jgi:cytochrome c5
MHKVNRSRLFFTIMAAIILMLALSACGDSAEVSPTATAVEAVEAPEESQSTLSGADIYGGLCIACHGADARGVPNLGKDLTVSEFFAGASDADLVAFIAEGRAADHPDNSTGVAMPPRGGNPTLTDDDLAAVVDYVRELVAASGN